MVGDLLILIPKNVFEFSCYVLDLDDDKEEILAALGVEPFDSWAIYRNGTAQVESEDECLEAEFNVFSKLFEKFPPGEVFSEKTREILAHCRKGLLGESADERLVQYYETEYKLFQAVERQLCQNEIGRLFKDVDDFLQTAGSIMNRRKARAGRSLENHAHFLLSEAKIPHEMRPRKIDGKPDIIFPDQDAYLNPSYPDEKIIVLGVKTTCKDRWRQVLNEGKRIQSKYILTLQPTISVGQLTEMHSSGVTLVVPDKFRHSYPKNHPAKILSFQEFLAFSKKISTE